MPAERHAEQTSPELACFDVFDTCLTRKWILPTDLFYELHGHLQGAQDTHLTADEWVEVRIAGEAAARKEHASGEATLAEIYQNIGVRLGWQKPVELEAMRQELEVESRNLRPVPEIRERIHRLKANGTAVVFVSDTYFSSGTVSRFLKEQGVSDGTERIYVSCEARASKDRGTLFDVVLKAEGVNPEQVRHTGDNFHSDIKVPRGRQLAADPYTDSRPTRYERIARASGSFPLNSLLPGASRLARLDGYQLTGKSRAIWDTSAGVVGPALFGFVLWCLERARSVGVKRLYFVARDGQVLLKIANAIQARWPFDVECRYLYGSRQAWHIAGAGDTAAGDGLSWLLENTHFLSISSILKRANIALDDAEEPLRACGFDRAAWDLNLNDTERSTLRHCFRSAGMKEQLRQSSDLSRGLALAYLEQEGLAEGKRLGIRIGVVDIGWNGRLHRSLARLLEEGGIEALGGLHGFYFGLECEEQIHASNPLFSYFYAGGKPKANARLCSNKALWELFVAADTGGVVGYTRDGDKVVPVLSHEGTEGRAWGVLHQQAAVESFAEHLVNAFDGPLDCGPEKIREILVPLLEPLISEPSAEESEAYGSYLFAQDQAHWPLYELAPPLSVPDALKALAGRYHRHGHAWLPASARRSGWLIAALLSPRVMQMRERLKKALGR